MLWENLREEEFDSAITRSQGVCVIPLGCIEKHGQHLPVGTDYFEAMHIVRSAAELEDVVIFSAGAWLGDVACFHAFSDPAKAGLRGCIGIKQETLMNVLDELCREIARNGFNKILIVNGHGGNDAMLKHFLRVQSYESKDYAVLSTSAYAFSDINPKKLLGIVTSRKKDFSYLTPEDYETLLRFKESGTGGGHADIRETSLMMAYDSSLVAEDRYEAESGASLHRTERLERAGVDTINLWLANYPNSYCALPPHGASETLGRAMTQICAERLADIFRLVKSDDECLKAAKMAEK